MILRVRRSDVWGSIKAPPSKSYTHRALICSALARGESRISSPLQSDDTIATSRALRMLGVEISEEPERWTVRADELHKPESELFCDESGTTLRFMTSLSSLVNGECKLTGGPSLSKRPMDPLLQGLRQMGVECSGVKGHPPILIKGEGKIRGGNVSMRGDVSSQFVSAILLIAPRASGGTTLELTTPLESKPYVSMTIDVQRAFGVESKPSKDMRTFKAGEQMYEPSSYSVEGDWSSASYLLAAGALGGEVTIDGLNNGSLQADANVARILRLMGAETTRVEGGLCVRRSDLQSIEADLSDSPDLFPIVSTLCAVADGESVLTGVGRLQYKESNRGAAMIDGLSRMGIKVADFGDHVVITGGSPKGCMINTRKDHRIAMAFAVLGLAAEGETKITHAECVAKSYPGFWGALERLGADLGG